MPWEYELDNEALAKLELELRPGGASASGFLAPGERLRDVLARDRQALASLGYTAAQLADALEVLLGRAQCLDFDARLTEQESSHRGPRALVVDGAVEVQCESYCGAQDCPFASLGNPACERTRFGNSDFTLKRVGNEDTLRVPGLLPHLLREHEFFEGSVPYRVEPEALVRALALETLGLRRPLWRSEKRWGPFSWRGRGLLPWAAGLWWYWQPHVMPENAVRPSRWDEMVQLAPSVRALRAGDWAVLLVRGRHTLEGDERLDGAPFLLRRMKLEGEVQLRRSAYEWVDLERTLPAE